MANNLDRARFSQKNLLFMFSITVLVPLIAVFSSKAFMETQKDQPLLPDVLTISAQGSPIYFSSARLSVTDSSSLEVELTFVNVGGKPIRAYTIRYDAESANQRKLSSGAHLVNSESAKSVIKPHDNRIERIDCGSYWYIPKSIRISLDFVEFADGTSWGADSFNSADRLSGKRSGARAVTEYLSDMHRKGGLPAVIDSLNKDFTDIVPTASHSSPAWLDGFLSGKNAVVSRIRRTYKMQGQSSVLAELEKPYDASERGR